MPRPRADEPVANIIHTPRGMNGGRSGRFSHGGHSGRRGSGENLRMVQRFSQATEKVIKAENAEKLGVDFTWKHRRLMLTTHHLWLTATDQSDDVDNSLAHDYIPLEEVVLIRNSAAENHLSYDDGPSSPSPVGEQRTSSTGSKILRSVAAVASSLTRNNLQASPETPVMHNMFDLITDEKGINCGRTYTFRMHSAVTCKAWMELLKKETHRRSKELSNLNALRRLQEKARRLYDSSPCQYLVALLIIFNFVLNAWQAEFHPDSLGSSTADASTDIFQRLDVALTCVFSAELLLNMFGHWFWPFVTDGWSMFDFIVVLFSVVSLFIENIPFFSILRVIRAFRILRVIKRFQSLRRIFNAVIHSIIPVANALFIAIMIMAIYTIIGVFLFADDASEFGTFGRAMYTLFELTAFTIWPSALPAFQTELESGRLLTDINVILFVVSFVAVVSWTMLQVLVAVLLDNFMSATAEDRAQALIALRTETKSKNMGPFDPLLSTLVDGSDTEKELISQIRAVWHVIDVDGTGLASFTQVREGLLKLNLTPRVRLNQEDYASATEDFALCDAERRLSLDSFQVLIHHQLATYLQRRLSDAAAIASPHGEGEAILQGLKLLLTILNRNDVATTPPEHVRGRAVHVQEEHEPGSLASQPRTPNHMQGYGWRGRGGGGGVEISAGKAQGEGELHQICDEGDWHTAKEAGKESAPGRMRLEELEASLASTRQEIAEVQRVQQEQLLPSLRQLHATTDHILQALTSLAPAPPTSPPTFPSTTPPPSRPRRSPASGYAAAQPQNWDGGRGVGYSGVPAPAQAQVPPHMGAERLGSAGGVWGAPPAAAVSGATREREVSVPQSQGRVPGQSGTLAPEQGAIMVGFARVSSSPPQSRNADLVTAVLVNATADNRVVHVDKSGRPVIGLC